MKSILTAGGLAAVLIFAGACKSTTAPANTTTNTAATANANKPAQTANTANTPAANTTNTASSNTSASNEGGDQDFTLVNSTGVVINKLFISPHDKDDWEEDILGQDTLANGQSLDIKFHRDEKGDMWDLRVEDTQGHAIEWENLKLTEISKVTLHYENGKATAETE